MHNAIYDIAIIGAGASGMMAAISAHQTDSSLRIALLERQERVGRKLLATGNGRCNLTNMRSGQQGYHGDTAFAYHVLSLFPPEKIKQTFECLGVRSYADEEGRVYPLCNQASAVLDALRCSCAEAGAEELCAFDCVSIKSAEGVFGLTARDQRSLRAKRVIVCAGGMASPKTGGTDEGVQLLQSLGMRSTPRRPSLAPVDIDGDFVKALKGQRYQGGVSLIIDGEIVHSEQGEILFTDTGLSGIAVMQLSKEAGDGLRSGKRVSFALHLLPDDPEKLTDELFLRAERFARRELNDYLTGLVAKRIGQAALKQAKIAPLNRECDSLTMREIRSLARILTSWQVPIKRVQGFESAQATAGGINTIAFNPKTMESKLLRGLYAAGEVLNVDGDCGGFNLQWAWASGMLAGSSAAASLHEGE